METNRTPLLFEKSKNEIFKMLNLFLLHLSFKINNYVFLCVIKKKSNNQLMDKLRVIITGATGMVGEGVLHECLNHSEVEKVLAITRHTTGYKHPKFTEIVHKDFFCISSLKNQLTGYNACYFCLGVTSVGKKEPEYTKLTYDLTLNFARTLAELNPDMTFCYISGTGTDSTETGRVMWARVKGKTENDLMKLSFKGVYNFRPGGIEPFLPLRPTHTYYSMYKYMKWAVRFMKLIIPHSVIHLRTLAAVMIYVSQNGYTKPILEMKDMKQLAKEI